MFQIKFSENLKAEEKLNKYWVSITMNRLLVNLKLNSKFISMCVFSFHNPRRYLPLKISPVKALEVKSTQGGNNLGVVGA